MLDGQWICGFQVPIAIDNMVFPPLCLLEVPTYDATNVDGTAILEIPQVAALADTAGIFLEANPKGASSLERQKEIDYWFGPALGAGKALLHLCKTPRAQCRASHGARVSMHADTFRVRSRSTVLEPWCRANPNAGHGAGPPPGGPDGDGGLGGPDKRFEELKQLLGNKREKAAEQLANAVARRLRKKGDAGLGRDGMDDGSDSGGEGNALPFRLAPSLDSTSIQQFAQKKEGELYMKTIEEMTQYLGAKEGASGERVHDPARWVAYLITVLQNRVPLEKMGLRDSRELRTLAEALDALGKGDLPRLGDLLAQRFKSVESKILNGSWNDSLELIPPADLGLATNAEQRLATREQMAKLKLLELRAKVAKGGKG